MSDWKVEDFTDDQIEKNMNRSGFAGYSLILIAVITLTIGIIWANVAQIDEVTHGSGTVEPRAGVRQLQSLEGGFVERIYVRKGDEVQKNDLLVTLHNPKISAELNAAEVKKGALDLRQKRLQAEIEGRTPSYNRTEIETYDEVIQRELQALKIRRNALFYQLEALESELAVAKAQKEGYTVELKGLQEQEAILIQERNIIFPLVDKGTLPATQKIDLQKQLSDVQNQIYVVSSRIPEQDAAIEGLEKRLEEAQNKQESQIREEAAVTEAEITRLTERIENRKIAEEAGRIRANTKGIIKEMAITSEGDVVESAEVVVELVPLEEKLKVLVRLEPQDRGQIRIDEELTEEGEPNKGSAAVSITAYDSSIYGSLSGRVISISPDTIQDEADPDVKYFHVEVITDRDYLENKSTGEKLQIIPGMAATVDIKTGSTTVMQRLLRPLKKALREAGREN